MSIVFSKVWKSFGAKTILKGISFNVEPGEILFVLGKSGTGKSVTLKHMVGLMKPDSGEVWVDDAPVHRMSEDELAVTRKKCGMVFQHPALLDSLTVFENVAFGLKNNQVRESAETLKAIEDRVIKKLSLVHLGEEILDLLPSQISYGMQKRVSIARTLAPNPNYLLFDEPTTGLDPISTRAITGLIRDLSRTLRVTSVVVSHDMESALEVADRILVLDQGMVLAIGAPEEIRRSPLPLVQDFLREVTS